MVRVRQFWQGPRGMIILGLVVAVLLDGCGTTRRVGNKECTTGGETWGQVIGAVGGAAAGAFLGSYTGNTASAVIGGLIGGVAGTFLGGKVGSLLDECEQLQAAQATEVALNTPVEPVRPGGPVQAQTITWSSQSRPDAGGSATVVDVGEASTGQECRKVRQIAYVGGEEVTEYKDFCRTPAGSWEPMA